MKKQYLAVLFGCTLIVLASVTLVLLNNNPEVAEPRNYTYNIVNVYPHDATAFTEGLVFDSGNLYEGTGRYGESSLRCVDLESGNVTQLYMLSPNYFGEGITIFEEKIFQLTWTSNKGFVYNKDSFDLVTEFEYPTEGWGLTHNGTHLIMSDGTSTLYFLDPETFQTVDQIEVIDEFPVVYLNELEYINGKICANIWQQDKIAVIEPQTGQVEGWIDLEGIYDQGDGDVLNGITYDPVNDRLFVTGKLWSKLFEIKLVPVD